MVSRGLQKGLSVSRWLKKNVRIHACFQLQDGSRGLNFLAASRHFPTHRKDGSSGTTSELGDMAERNPARLFEHETKNAGNSRLLQQIRAHVTSF